MKKCLDGLVEQNINLDEFEIVVVDNGSKDDTKNVVDDFVGVFANLLYVYEEKPGLSVARNKALEISTGKLIAYLDDDAIPGNDWVDRIHQCWSDYKPDCFGGKVDPIWERNKPNWLTEDLYGIYSLMDYSDSSVAMERPNHPWGVNIVFNKNVLLSLGGFPEKLGRVGSKLLSGEESWVCETIYINNGLIWYDPRIRVQHLIPAERLSLDWVRKRVFWSGVSAAVSESLRQRYSRVHCVGRGFRKLFNVIKKAKYILAIILVSFNNRWISSASKGLFKLGYTYGMFYMAFGKVKLD